MTGARTGIARAPGRADIARRQGRRGRPAGGAPQTEGRWSTSRPGRFAPWRALALLLFAAAGAALAQPTGPQVLELTLDETIRLAIGNNRSLERNRLRREADGLALEVAEQRYRPRGSVDASVRTDDHGDEHADVSIGPGIRVPTGGEVGLRWSEPVGGGSGGSGTWRLSFSQPLLKGFGIDIDTAPVRIARIREKMNVLAFRDTIAGTIESAISAYRGLIRANRAIAISREALGRARKQHETNRSLIRAGRMAEREIIQSEAEIANRELSLVERENALRAADTRLLSILDLDGVSRVVPVDEMPAVDARLPDLERSLATAFASRSDYLSAQMRTEIAQMDLDGARNDQLWDLRLTANVSRGAGDGSDYGAALGLSVPLGEGTSRELALMRVKHGVRDAEAALVELRESIRSDVRQAVHDVEVGLRRIGLARRARELAEEQLEVERAKLTQGLTSAYQLTTVEDGLVRALNGELDAVVSYFNALVALDRASGTTLERWGIEVEAAGAGSIEVRGEGAEPGAARAAVPTQGRAPAVGDRDVATSGPVRVDDEWPVREPPRRAVEAAERALAAVRAGAGAQPRSGASSPPARALLLSVGEFETESGTLGDGVPAATGAGSPPGGAKPRIGIRDSTTVSTLSGKGEERVALD